MRTFSWLHISDLHFKADDTLDRRMVLRALLDQIHEIVPREHPVDAVFCTGDIAFSGGAGGNGNYPEYVRALDFFGQLGTHLQLKQTRMFFVPGNHDVDRGRVLEDQARPLSSPEKADEWLTDLRHHPELADRFHGFEWFAQQLRGIRPYEDGRAYGVHDVETSDGVRVVVIELNSAWHAVDDEDQGKLVIGEAPIVYALDETRLKQADLVVALVHHPLDWLTNWDREQAYDLLAGEVDVVLRGHLHVPRIESLTSFGGALIVMAAGAGYQTRRWPNRVVRVRVDFDKRIIDTVPFRLDERGRGGWVVEPRTARKPPRTHWSVDPESTSPVLVVVQESMRPIDEQSIVQDLQQRHPLLVRRLQVDGATHDWSRLAEQQETWWRQVRAELGAPVVEVVTLSSAEIPLSLQLGFLITDWYPLRALEWHRDTGTWQWPSQRPPEWSVSLACTPGGRVDATGSVIVRVSVSAMVTLEVCRAVVPDAVLDVHVSVPNPRRDQIFHPDQLQELVQAFRRALVHIRANTQQATALHLFYAGPASGGILLGREINPRMTPEVVTYYYSQNATPRYQRAVILR